MDAKKYNLIKISLGIFKGVISFTFILMFLVSGWSLFLESFLEEFIPGQYLLFLAYVVLLSIAGGIIFFPLNVYVGYFLEHKYKLSNQTFVKWIWEGTKGILVGGAIGIPLLLLFYFVLNLFLDWWWLPFALIMFIVSVILAQVLPVLILPIFYKVKPLDNIELKDRITNLAVEAGIKVENIYKFDMSKNTNKANAAFTGLGKTKRIILGDTLLENYSIDEIETVVAHELGHFKRKHIVKNIIIGTLFSFLTFFLIAQIYSVSLNWFGFNSITQISALPLLGLCGMLIGVLQTPISNMISRKFEYQADEYAVETTSKHKAFIDTLEKLTDQNLGDRNPHPLIEWYFYSHPSIENRKRFILSVMDK
ncbi:M48 family metallopeptidase [Bacteroidota bacterium]